MEIYHEMYSSMLTVTSLEKFSNEYLNVSFA